MLTRRLCLAAAIALTATAAFPQGGKKGAGSGMGSDSGPSPSQGFNVAGNYSARGMNADGSIYEGQVRITQDGTRIDMAWSIGNDSYTGEGLIDGRIVAVDWGSDMPVVYVVMPDGELHGTWDDGKALEKLTPR